MCFEFCLFLEKLCFCFFFLLFVEFGLVIEEEVVVVEGFKGVLLVIELIFVEFGWDCLIVELGLVNRFFLCFNSVLICVLRFLSWNFDLSL